MDALENEMMKVFSIMGKSIGFKNPVIKMLSILFLEPSEVAMEELAQRTGYSLASVSNTMKMLETTGIIQRIKNPGTKKVFFYMEKDLVRLNIQKLKKMQEAYVRPATKLLPQIIKEYRKKAKDEQSKQKLKIIKNYYKQMLAFSMILNKWEKDLDELSNKKWY